MGKKELRIWAKNKRKELDMTSISKILVDKLRQTNEYKISKNIMIFYPLESEVDLLSLTEDDTKAFYLPRIKDDILECCPYTVGDELCKSSFNTKEPVCEACSKTVIDMIVVPALACDKNNYRLGYGGGFYDRLLKDFNGEKVVCIPPELVIETIYPEKHDIKMDLVIF